MSPGGRGSQGQQVPRSERWGLCTVAEAQDRRHPLVQPQHHHQQGRLIGFGDGGLGVAQFWPRLPPGGVLGQLGALQDDSLGCGSIKGLRRQ